jgi:hypothetical protein
MSAETIKLGEPPDPSHGRDCVHVAIVPVEAACPIRPGSDVWLTATGQASWGVKGEDDTVGIADPFLRETIQKGQWFWLVLYPNTITGMRHVWKHPAFAPKLPAPRKEAGGD